MELSIDPETAERIARGVLGVLSFIALIAWCRWLGTPEDQREVTPPEVKEENAKKETVRSIRRLCSDFDYAIICVTHEGVWCDKQPGAISLSNSSDLLAIDASKTVNPLRLPPGWDRLATKREPIGSAISATPKSGHQNLACITFGATAPAAPRYAPQSAAPHRASRPKDEPAIQCNGAGAGLLSTTGGFVQPSRWIEFAIICFATSP